MHIKRKTIGNFWPIQRTGDKWMAVPTHNQRNSMPLMIVARDVLKIVKSKKELKKILNEKKIIINGKIVKETNYPIGLFDSLSIPLMKKQYKVVLKNKRFDFVEVSEKQSETRVYKVIGKRQMAGKKVQVNLSNGRNILTSEKIAVGDFVVMDNLKNKILKIISLKKDVEVLVIAGKHTGKSGKIKEILKAGENSVAEIKTKEGEIKANIKNIFAIE